MGWNANTLVMEKHTPAEIKERFLAAPSAVQEALADEGLATEFILHLRDRFGLPIDKLAPAAALVRDVLIGLATPAEFHSEMAQFAGGEEKATQITTAFNEEVMKQLQASERTVGAAPGAAPASPLVDAPLATPAKPLVQEPVEPGHTTVRTMAMDMDAAKEHRAPAPVELPATPVMPQPAAVNPPPMPIPKPAPVPERPPMPATIPGAPKVVKYGTDPYREPIE